MGNETFDVSTMCAREIKENLTTTSVGAERTDLVWQTTKFAPVDCQAFNSRTRQAGKRCGSAPCSRSADAMRIWHEGGFILLLMGQMQGSEMRKI